MNKSTNYRIILFMFIIVFLLLIIVYNLFSIQINKSSFYKDKLDKLKVSTFKVQEAPRGRIYDRNYNLLVDNVGVKTIYYRKEKNVSSMDEINIAFILSKNINIDISSLTDYDLRYFFYLNNKDKIDKRITKEELNKYKERKITKDDLNNLKLEKITAEELILPDEYKRAAYIYFLMNNGYYFDEKIIKSYASDKEYAFVGENLSVLKGVNIKLEWERKYLYGDTFRTILGNISTSKSGIPKELKDKYLDLGYSLNDRVGVSYLEYQYEKYLKPKKSLYKINNDNSYSKVKEGIRGNDIVLTIDINIQKEVENILEEEIKNAKENDLYTTFYNGSRVVVLESKTGEVLAMASKEIVPSIDGYKIYDNTPSILTNPVTPGSIVKGASMTVGYKTGAINIGTRLLDHCIKLSGTSSKCSWRSNLGVLDDISALSYSSNSYQYQVALKVLNTNNDPFSIYRNTFKEYGLGEKTNIDLPVESYGSKGSNDTPGTLLDFSIGQYDTYTPIQISEYINTISQKGNKLQIHLLKEIRKGSNSDSLGKIVKKVRPKQIGKVDISDEYINRIRDGFSEVMNKLGYGYMGDVPDSSGKTGTAQSFIDSDNDGNVDKETISKGFVGYAPKDDPKFSLVVLSPNVRYNDNTTYVSPVNFKISQRVSNKVFEIFK